MCSVIVSFSKGNAPSWTCACSVYVGESGRGCASSFKPLTAFPLGIRVFFQDLLFKAHVLATEEAISRVRDLSRLSREGDGRNPSVAETCASPRRPPQARVSTARTACCQRVWWRFRLKRIKGKLIICLRSTSPLLFTRSLMYFITNNVPNLFVLRPM